MRTATTGHKERTKPVNAVDGFVDRFFHPNTYLYLSLLSLSIYLSTCQRTLAKRDTCVYARREHTVDRFFVDRFLGAPQ